MLIIRGNLFTENQWKRGLLKMKNTKGYPFLLVKWLGMKVGYLLIAFVLDQAWVFITVNKNTVKLYMTKAAKKKSWFSSAPSSHFYKKYFKKESRSSSNTQSWETHEMHVFFWWYGIFARPAHHFSTFFWWEPRHLFFNLKKKENRSPSSFFNFFLMRTKTFIFRGLTGRGNLGVTTYYTLLPLQHVVQNSELRKWFI